MGLHSAAKDAVRALATEDKDYRYWELVLLVSNFHLFFGMFIKYENDLKSHRTELH